MPRYATITLNFAFLLHISDLVVETTDMPKSAFTIALDPVTLILGSEGAVLSLSPPTPGSAMTGLSSISSSEPLRTISDRVGGAGSSTSSELSALSISSEDGGIIVAKGPARRSSVGGQTKGKRPRESEASDAPAKKLKSDGEQVERGIYCHQ
jgi:hypothetical protein